MLIGVPFVYGKIVTSIDFSMFEMQSVPPTVLPFPSGESDKNSISIFSPGYSSLASSGIAT